jgi:uncharacterized protein YlxP (DUF503 family)
MEKIFLGVARLVLLIPGARTLKDRRQAVSSVRDRVAHRFPVSIHEVDTTDHPGRQVVVVTSAANDPAVLRSTLDRIVAFARSCGPVHVAEVDVDVFRWQIPDRYASPLELTPPRGLSALEAPRPAPEPEDSDG